MTGLFACTEAPFDPNANPEVSLRGDLNLDGIAFTVADMVMFTNYYIEGQGALYYEDLNGYTQSIEASDVNGDGRTLELADLVFLIRVIVGDELPIPKVIRTINAIVTYDNQGTLSVNHENWMGAAFVIFEGHVTPVLLAENMEMKSAFDGRNTRVLIYSMDASSFSGDFVNGNANVLSIEMATARANRVRVITKSREYALDQNYPNPFNPTTTIEFNLPQESDYELVITNSTNKVVASFIGHGHAGVESIVWDATGLGSGFYYATLTIGDWQGSIKMMFTR